MVGAVQLLGVISWQMEVQWERCACGPVGREEGSLEGTLGPWRQKIYHPKRVIALKVRAAIILQ